MNPNTQALQDLGQSLWIDDITRTMLADGTLRRDSGADRSGPPMTTTCER